MAEYDILISGDVWDDENGYRTNRWVAINDDTIAGIYTERPGDAIQEFDLPILLPGLIDMHVHLVWDGGNDPVQSLKTETKVETLLEAVGNARRQVRGGVTTIRDLGSTYDIAIDVGRAIEMGNISGPRVFASGRTIIISGGHDPFWGIPSNGVDACRQTVRELRSAGAEVIKVSATGGVYGQAVGEDPGMSELSFEELEAIVDEAARFDLPVTAHAVGQEGISNAVEAGVDTIEHGNLLDDRTLDEMEQRGISYDPTLYTYWNIATNDNIPEYAANNARRVYEHHQKAFENAIQRDIRILAGSDAGSPELPHPSLHLELEMMTETGLSAERTLASATSIPARELGQPGLGTVEPDTPADIVGFSEDPRSNISTVEEPGLVISNGAVEFVDEHYRR